MKEQNESELTDSNFPKALSLKTMSLSKFIQTQTENERALQQALLNYKVKDNFRRFPSNSGDFDIIPSQNLSRPSVVNSTIIGKELALGSFFINVDQFTSLCETLSADSSLVTRAKIKGTLCEDSQKDALGLLLRGLNK